MANKTLVIVESPAKAKTINKYLGKNYIVEASVGHIKDLVKFNLSVDVNNGFEPKYVTIRGKADVIKNLKKLSENASKVLIATDPDREGEAIAWHIAEEVKKVNTNIQRVIFNEITKTGIQHGISEPREIDHDMFMSQQARRVLDRLIGYQVSPFLSRAMLEKTTQTLSAGRVQSVALRMICEREKEISIFRAIEYWNITGDFATQSEGKLKAKLIAFDGKNIKNPEGSGSGATDEEKAKAGARVAALHFIRTKEQAVGLIKNIKKEDYSISEISKKQVKRKPQPPFTTSYLQQEASRRLGFSNKKTMSVAQKLYEGVNIGEEGAVGLITYMRTDSVRISPDAQNAAREHIGAKFGSEYLPPAPPQYTSKSSNVQDAHEAIRPASLDYTPEMVRRHLSKDDAELYELIYNRFLASQMNPAVLDQTTVNIQGGDFIFRATGSVVVFKGFLVVYDDMSEDTAKGKDAQPNLPEGMAEKQSVALKGTDSSQAFTKPPARYNEASLVKELDELGIGRPSTYAQIVSTLLDREYVELEKKAFIPTELGMDVNEILTKHFEKLFNVSFTANMEGDLDIIADGKKLYAEVMQEFYEPFRAMLKYAEDHSDIPEIECPVCSAPMVIKVSRTGRFLGCSRYPECKGTKPLPKPNKDNKEKEEPRIAEGIVCDICGKEMYIRESRFGKFYGCVDYPQCKGTKPFTMNLKCPKCGEGDIVERYSPKSRKKFWGCSAYPKCDHITNYEPVAHICEKCGNGYLEIRFRKVEGGYEKYLSCPACKEKFEMSILDKKPV